MVRNINGAITPPDDQGSTHCPVHSSTQNNSQTKDEKSLKFLNKTLIGSKNIIKKKKKLSQRFL